MTQLSHGGQLCDKCQSICTTTSVHRALVIGSYAYIKYVVVDFAPCIPIIFIHFQQGVTFQQSINPTFSHTVTLYPSTCAAKYRF